jgi:hypothetical protein
MHVEGSPTKKKDVRGKGKQTSNLWKGQIDRFFVRKPHEKEKRPGSGNK